MSLQINVPQRIYFCNAWNTTLLTVCCANPGQTCLQPCSLLSVGQTFSGTQNVSSPQKEEAWRVNVRIQGCDLNHGYLCGTMEALNVPMADTPSQVEVDGGKSLDLSNYQYIFMRWKEQYFVNVGSDCGLTIAGFYYVCFSCVDGSINGYYYDPNSRFIYFSFFCHLTFCY
ncbi:putative vacuolar import/degradation protein Vid24 [Helianthus annuus]|nr:putative vacuolar import/degradation protein Vid24 [Helianthus annuus]